MTQFYEPLYKTRKDGKTQIWWMERDANKVRSHSAQYDGSVIDSSLVTSEWKAIEGTNEGKANERNPEDQADFEVKRHYRLRMEAGAVYNIGDAPMVEGKIAPMLADTYSEKKGVKFPCYTQPKLDGMRAVVTSSGMWSRNWKPVVSAPHISRILQKYTDEGFRFDGELYNHDLKNDFNKIMSLAKKSKPTQENLDESEELLEYWVFDVIVPETPYSTRMEILEEIVSELGSSKIIIPPYAKVTTQAELDEHNDSYIYDGYEGQMIRYDTNYEHTRSKNLIKRKSFIDEEFVITHIEEGTGNWGGTGKVIHSLNKEGKPFKSTLKNNFEYAKEVWENRDKYVNGEVTCRFQNYTPDGIPRFPIAIHIYEGKRDT